MRYQVKVVLKPEGGEYVVIDNEAKASIGYEFFSREAAEESCQQLNEVWEEVTREIQGRAA